MKIAIIAAMSKELRLILPMLSDVATSDFLPADSLLRDKAHCGRIGEHSVVAMQCGIGKVNAAMGTALLINDFRPDLVINTGVAAGASDAVAVMDIVAADSVAHHDFWCIGEVHGQVPGSPLTFPAALPQGADGIIPGLIVTGEQFITSREQVEAIKEHFPAAKAIDMESAAIAQVCHSLSTPVMVLRVISDSPWTSHDNSAQYEDFWEDAPRKSFETVKSILHSL